MNTIAQPDFTPFNNGRGKDHPVVPEASFYGAVFMAFSIALLWWRRARRD